MRNLFFYLFLMLFTVYVEIMYDNSSGITFLAFEILLLAAMFFLSWYFKSRIKANLRIWLPVSQKDQEIKLEVGVKNEGLLPVTRICLWLAAENPHTSRKEKVEMDGSVGGKAQTILPCTAWAGCCGRVQFSVWKMKVWDYLGIFGRKIKCTEKIYVNILPDFHEIQVQLSERTKNFPVDGEEYEKHRSGDDPSEIFQVREFRDGDTLQRVHWKLSAKADELMTKEFGRPVGCCVLLLLDLHLDSLKEMDIYRMDVFIEIAASLVFSLREAGILHYTAWFDEEKGGIVRQYVKEEDQVYEMLDGFFGAVPYVQNYDLQAGYLTEFPGERFSTVLRLDTDLRLLLNENEEALFRTEQLEEQLSGLLLEV